MEKIYTTEELREKEIINVYNGSVIGRASDFEFDICDAKITALIVPCNVGFWDFGKHEQVYIPWESIQCIGEDTILVKMAVDDNCNECGKSKVKKCRWF